MKYDTEIKVGDKTFTVKGKNRPPAQAKVVDAPEKKAPRKSTGASSKEV